MFMVKELKEFIKKMPDNTPIYVGCEGYTNYAVNGENSNSASNTRLLLTEDGSLIICDNCVLEGVKANVLNYNDQLNQ